VLFVCHDLTELSTIPSIQIVSLEVNAVPLAGTAARQSSQGSRQRDGRMLRAANRRGERPPPLNVAKLAAIAPDACRLH